MNFQGLQRVEDAQTYLDTSFRAGREAVDNHRMQKEYRSQRSRIEKSKNIELVRMSAIRASLTKSLSRLLTSFPNTTALPVFYHELLKTTIDYYPFKKALATCNWARERINGFHEFYSKKLKGSREMSGITRVRKEFFGRVSSIMYQLEKPLKFLEYSRKTMKEFPTIKTETPTISLVGFPNIGKTTLLFKLTSSKPEISNYAFTTTKINVSYFKEKVGKKGEETEKKIQVLDTPGTLNRFDKMNMVEKQAYLAMKYCSDLFVYIFDLTEPFPLKEQEKLFRETKKFDKKMIVYLSKADILPAEKIQEFAKKYNAIWDAEELKQKIIDNLNL